MTGTEDNVHYFLHDPCKHSCHDMLYITDTSVSHEAMIGTEDNENMHYFLNYPRNIPVIKCCKKIGTEDITVPRTFPSEL